MFRKILLLTLVLILSVSFAYGASIICGIVDSTNATVCSNSSTLNLVDPKANSGDNCVCSISTCTRIGEYRAYTYTDNDFFWDNGVYTTDNDHTHLLYANRNVKIIGYGVAQRGFTPGNVGGGTTGLEWIGSTLITKCCDSMYDVVNYDGNCVPGQSGAYNAIRVGASYVGNDMYATPITWGYTDGNPSSWLDCDRWDGPGTFCNNICPTKIPGEATAGEYDHLIGFEGCCGDDSNENVIIEASSTDAPSGYNDGTTACCDNSLDCNYNNVCSATTQTSSPATPNKAYCSNKIWYGGDHSTTACTAIGGTWLASGTGTNSLCCGDDTTSDDFEQTSGEGRKCCYNGAELADGATSLSIICSNGQMYDCGNQVAGTIWHDDITSGSCTVYEGKYCNGTSWVDKKPNGCSCTSGSECISLMCIGGTCKANCDSDITVVSLCSYNSAAAYTNYGVCTQNTTASECDTSAAARNTANSGTLYDLCSHTSANYGYSCDSGSLSGGYTANGVCGGSSHGTCYTDYASDTTSLITPSSIFGTQAAVCAAGYNTYYCDAVSNGAFTPGNQRCDGSDTACRNCTFATHVDTESLCESGCGADASSDEKTPAACDGTSGFIGGTCTYYSDGDYNSTVCSCVKGGTGYWNLGGEISNCCGDDSYEFNNSWRLLPNNPGEQFNKIGPNNASDNACCNLISDCVFKNTCYSNNTYYDLDSDSKEDFYCYNGYWRNVDYYTSYCTANSFNWSIGGNADVEGGYYTTTGSRPNWCNITADGFPSSQCCCGDDSGENVIIEKNRTDAPAPYKNNNVGSTCCDNSSDCAETASDVCTNLNNIAGSIPNRSICFSGNTWYGGDHNITACNAIAGINRWVLGGEVAQTDCCGDDSYEFNLTERGDSDAPPDYKNSISTCCNVSTDCTHNDTCYANTQTSTLAIPNKAHCQNSIWYGGDDNLAACNAIAGIGKWNAAGWQGESTTRCCGDDLNEYNVSSDGRAACCNNPTDWVDVTFHCRGDLEQASWFYGRVINATSRIGIAGARVVALGGDRDEGNIGESGVEFSNFTDSSGYYKLFVAVDRTYDLMASAIGYAPNTTSNIYIGYQQAKSVNFTLRDGPTNCEEDCTFNNDNTCHKECEGWNGCYFYDLTAMNKCDIKQKGWVVEYNATNNVVCCRGNPTPKLGAILISSEVSTPNKIRQIRVVMYQGRPIQMVVDVFR